MIGIYKITSPSGKVYIGQSWDVKDRWNHYKHHNRKNGQTKLENSFSKYGVNNHKFEMCQEFSNAITQKTLDKFEIFYIKSYKELGIELLNLRDGGYGAKHTKESKDKIRKAHLGKPKHTKKSKKKIGIASKLRSKNRTKQWRLRQRKSHLGIPKPFSKQHLINLRKSNCKSIFQYNLKGKLIKSWKSISEAATKLKIHNGHITSVAQGKRKTTGGYIWKYKKII